MAEAPVSFPEYWAIQFESAHAEVLQATEGLSDEQLHFLPSADTNSITWLAWHLYRWQDNWTAMPHGEAEAWVNQGWAERFGRATDTDGTGDTPEQVAAFHPGRDLLFGYVEAAHQATIERVKRLTQEQLTRQVRYPFATEAIPYWLGMIPTLSDTLQHTGQIAYLRGLVTGPGWRPYRDWSALAKQQ